MASQRIARLNQLAATANLDCIAIMPGPNMQYKVNGMCGGVWGST